MERKKVINRLMSDGAIYRCQGIVYAAKQNMADEEIVNLIQGLKKDPVWFLGRQVGWYAIVALEMLGVEKYTGDDHLIKEFIADLPQFILSLPEDLPE